MLQECRLMIQVNMIQVVFKLLIFNASSVLWEDADSVAARIACSITLSVEHWHQFTIVQQLLPTVRRPNRTLNPRLVMQITWVLLVITMYISHCMKLHKCAFCFPLTWAFNGEPLEWQPFGDCFEAAMHSNPSLANIQKLIYLRSQMRDEATRDIDGLLPTNFNYTHSVTSLCTVLMHG